MQSFTSRSTTDMDSQLAYSTTLDKSIEHGIDLSVT